MHRRRLSWFPRPPSPPWRAGPPPACRRRAARSTFSLVLPFLITQTTKYLSTRKGGQPGTLAASGAAHCHPAREAGAALLPWASVLTPEQASARTSAARSPHAASRSLRRSRPAGRSVEAIEDLAKVIPGGDLAAVMAYAGPVVPALADR